jgi:hypothetical protein
LSVNALVDVLGLITSKRLINGRGFLTSSILNTKKIPSPLLSVFTSKLNGVWIVGDNTNNGSWIALDLFSEKRPQNGFPDKHPN